ncbi:MAG TPA: helix-turn-helix domain-containing protein [Acidimicrobiales bacterium]|nr:helix-turn-helix domain-containing protein [Acidimicrobiales bacterium]
MTFVSDQAEAAASARTLRADARRNIERVLAAAEELFADQGLSVPIDLIAERAGVGVGTVYRHFPTKAALFEAVVMARLDGLLARARQLAAAADPGEALFTFASELVELAASKKDITDELARAGIDSERVHSVAKEQLQAAFEVLLERAQAAGAVRGDVSSPDVTALLMGTCFAAEQRADAECSRRLVAIVCDGLRTPGPRTT